ncbi:MAG: hypothetical protein VB031_02345 [Eubacteriaceae bacterium]|nr:hypothetical protein [Eubacteriaceae bacterium]
MSITIKSQTLLAINSIAFNSSQNIKMAESPEDLEIFKAYYNTMLICSKAISQMSEEDIDTMAESIQQQELFL